jgi:type II secretory pathway pseudopilin PulG
MVDDGFVGQSGPCAMCGRMVTVPQPAAGVRAVVGARPATKKTSATSVAMLVMVVVCALLGGVALIGVVVTVLAPVVNNARLTAQKRRSNDNLRQIAQALQQYHAQYSSYPPAFVLGKDGKPWHSWRVLILPQLGYPELYAQYNFEQKWDSPQNALLQRQMPPEFASPSDENAKSGFETSYLVVVGPETAFPGNKTRREGDLGDGLASTILVVESCESRVCWMEPGDLTFSKMDLTINGPTNAIRSNNPAGASAVFADGTPRFLPADLPPDQVEAFLSANKDDVAELDVLQN